MKPYRSHHNSFITGNSFKTVNDNKGQPNNNIFKNRIQQDSNIPKKIDKPKYEFEQTSTYSNLIDLAIKKKNNKGQSNNKRQFKKISIVNNNEQDNQNIKEDFPVLGTVKKNDITQKYTQNYSSVLKASIENENMNKNKCKKEIINKTRDNKPRYTIKPKIYKNKYNDSDELSIDSFEEYTANNDEEEYTDESINDELENDDYDYDDDYYYR